MKKSCGFNGEFWTEKYENIMGLIGNWGLGIGEEFINIIRRRYM